MTVAVDATQRHTRQRPCRICGGFESAPRGKGERCNGYLSSDGKVERCSREEHAGALKYDDGTGTYAHWLNGRCDCGERHGEGMPSRPTTDTAEWPYHDEASVPLYAVVRYQRDGEKRYVQRPASGKSGPGCMQGVRLVLYRLPELLTGDPAETVWILEGEKCVDRLRGLGHVATCNPGGAGKWRPEYSAFLRGRKVVILPDEDRDGKGMRHAEQVASMLAGIATSVTILRLPGLQPVGEDVVDWLDRGGTRDELIALAQRAPLWHAADTDSSFTSLNSLVRKASEPGYPSRPEAAAFHGLAGRIIDRIDPHTEADPAGILLQLIVAFGNAVGRGPHFQVEATRHHTNLFAAIVGQTSKSRKGTSWNHVVRLIGLADQNWANDRIIGGLSSGEGLIAEVRDPVSLNGNIVDAGVTDKRLMVVEQELARVLKVASREGNSLSAIIREGWDSGPLRVTTRNNPLRATNTHISIVSHITKDELLRTMTETEAANGFANRFLWAFVRRSKLLPEGGGVMEIGDLVRDLTAALDFARGLGDRQVKRDERAREIWISVYGELSKDRPGMAGAILGRIEAQVMRVALIYALMDRSERIAEPHMMAALAIAEYVEKSVNHIFGTSTGDRVADRILETLKAAPGGLTRKAISEALDHNVHAKKLEAALDLLRRSGLASSTTERSESGKGRPAERWKYEQNELNEQSPAVEAA